MAHAGATIAQAGSGGPKPAPAPSERSEQKRDLASWWRNFKKGDKKTPEQQQVNQGIFGIPLQNSIRYANVAISLLNDEGQSYIYGYVPIVVAKCGVFLKEKATDVEGIFRLAGSEKRIKELKVAFDSPDRYGKGLDWTGYTVHDAANILRRYFNQLPEPIIPLDFYDRFRDPLRNHQAQAVGAIESQSPSVGDFDQDAAIRRFQALITELPPLNRQLLLYILDLLAVFASKSDLNKMTTANLAAIFQPGILSHPQHDMAPQEYRLSQDVLIFLIENQDSFLIGMQGTAADPDTVREVQSGVPTPTKSPNSPTTPTRSKTVVGRTSSNASAGAESVRKFGGLRRNASVSSSKHSKKSEGGPIPVAPPMPAASTASSGVHRSNTVPSRRSGSNAQSPRFSRDKNSDPPTPGQVPAATVPVEANEPKRESLQATPVPRATSQVSAPPEVGSIASSEGTATMATIGSETSSAVNRDYQTPKRDTTPLLAPGRRSGEQIPDRAVSNTPSASGSRGFLDIFKQSPGSEGDGHRKPNKLQKKRVPGTSLSSAQSSSHSLHEGSGEHPKSPTTPFSPSAMEMQSPEGNSGEHSKYTTAHTTPTATHTAQNAMQHTPQRSTTDATLRPTASPTQSYHSTTDLSDADMVGDDLPKDQAHNEPKEKKRHRWRFSRSQNRADQPGTSSQQHTPTQPPSSNPMGTLTGPAAASKSTVGSTTPQPHDPNPAAASASSSQQLPSRPNRQSFQEAVTPSTTESPAPALATAATSASLSSPPSSSQQQATPHTSFHTPQNSQTDPAVFSDSERERRGPMSWIRGKIQERKELKGAERRNRTPESRGREKDEGSGDVEGARGAERAESGVEARKASEGASAAAAGAAATATPAAPAAASGAAAPAAPVAETDSAPAANDPDPAPAASASAPAASATAASNASPTKAASTPVSAPAAAAASGSHVVEEKGIPEAKEGE